MADGLVVEARRLDGRGSVVVVCELVGHGLFVVGVVSVPDVVVVVVVVVVGGGGGWLGVELASGAVEVADGLLAGGVLWPRIEWCLELVYRIGRFVLVQRLVGFVAVGLLIVKGRVRGIGHEWFCIRLLDRLQGLRVAHALGGS